MSSLEGNIPNPFRARTEFTWAIARPGRVRLEIFNVRGQLVRTLVDAVRAPGRYRYQWDGRDQRGAPVASGSYFYRLTANGFTETRRMIRIR